MNAVLPPGSTIGIIGGGQLGRMLAMAAARLGYCTIVVDPQPDCPAAQTANRQIIAAYDDREALRELSDRCDVVTYEFENVPVDAAESLARNLAVLPPPAALERAQDRLIEKAFLNDIGVETAPYHAVDSDADLASGLAEFGGNGVLKTRRLGYDGKGQIVIRNVSGNGADGTFAQMGNVPLILEGLIAFSHEISVIAARGRDGSMAAYDVAQNVHRDGILATSTVPAAVSMPVAKAAKNAAFRVLEALDYAGVIGVEFFVLQSGALLANEFAPRVHNSGHWTEAACAVSQFEQHIRAVCGLPLGDTARHSCCVMENLIGDDIDRVPEILRQTGAVLHLYGKTETRPGRKMGHVTRLSPN